MEHFCSKGRTSLHCQKVGETPGSPYVVRKLYVTDSSSKPKCIFLALAQQTILKNCTKHMQCTESDDFTEHYIIRYLSARELVLPPYLTSNLCKPPPFSTSHSYLCCKNEVCYHYWDFKDKHMTRCIYGMKHSKHTTYFTYG